MWTPASGCDGPAGRVGRRATEVGGMNVEGVLGLVVSLGLLVYLFYALLYPEKL